ncbi:MAG: FecR domain-containing protein [Comamonadaceae bacterium]|nr:FecR domain-containing protein [Comamonadaceae bacterium]
MKPIHTLLTVLAAMLLGLASPLAQAQTTLAGYVTRLRGEVQTLVETKTQPLVVGNALYLGQRVSTGADARLEARMTDGSVLTLGERTEFVIEQVAGSSAQAADSNFSLLKGVLRAITGKLVSGQSPASWQVRTPVASIGVRGTELWAGFDLLGAGSDTLDVVMLEGKGVYVKNSHGTIELARVGDGTTVKGVAASPAGLVPWGEAKLQAAQRSVSW